MFENFKYASAGNDNDVTIFSFDGQNEEDQFDEEYSDVLPFLALKNTVLYPGLVIPITVGRDRSLNAIRAAQEQDQVVAVFSQRDVSIEQPTQQDLYEYGVVARILKVLKMPDGNQTVILQGRSKCRMKSVVQSQPYMLGELEHLLLDTISDGDSFGVNVVSIKELAKQIVELSPQIPSEAAMMLQNIKSSSFLISFIASNLSIDVERKQAILEESDLNKKSEMILVEMRKELQLLEIRDQIESKVRGGIEQQQREYFLNQQLKTIQEELGQNPQDEILSQLEAKGKEKKWPEYARKQFNKEIARARRMNPQVAEYSVTLNYLELLIDLPWEEYSDDTFDLKQVAKVLDKDHFGLEKVKERILEHLAVLKLKGDMKAPILCLVGPPGVGKTSLGKSIAEAMGRKFIRMSLGGLHDESEIRGHRRTYIGAMPGRILQSLKKSGTSNPVFILDEIDKLGKNLRGDPSSALLEVLDPEQNEAFYDNYIEMDYDLSKILFIATANSLNTIQPALRDRMEIIQLSGYAIEEKIEIAKKYLVPKQVKNHGLKTSDVSISKPVLSKLVQDYTREAGVRSLDRTIGAVMRNIAKKVAMGDEYNVKLSKEDIREILGPEKVNLDKYKKVDVPGVVVGLAWTAVGGDILFVEASKSSGKGKLQLTGSLGDVMKESATTALSYVKSHAKELGVDPNVFDTTDLHIHVPEGAVPKDGPSAGVTMLTAISSILTGRKVKPRLAMSGEITLRGQVLPVGGIKEKILAAKRAGIKDIVLCHENKKNVDEVEPNYLKGVNFHYVNHMEEVLDVALQ